MKLKTLSLIAFFSITLLKVNSQELAIIGGMNISKMTVKDDEDNYVKLIKDEGGKVKARVGGHIGLLYGYNIKDNILLQTGFMFSTKGFKWSYVEKDYGYQFEERVKIKLNYLEIPFLASYQHSLSNDLKLHAGLGPVLAIAISGKMHSKYRDEETWRGQKDIDTYEYKEKLIGNKDKSDNEIKRGDLGLMFQVGIQYNKYKLGLFYNQGLLNISKKGSEGVFEVNDIHNSGYREKNRMFGISAAYVIDFN